jgi:hypothetical protein
MMVVKCDFSDHVAICDWGRSELSLSLEREHLGIVSGRRFSGLRVARVLRRALTANCNDNQLSTSFTRIMRAPLANCYRVST